MTEASFQTEFNKWVRNVYKKTGAFELKLTKTDSLPFSAIKEHQIAALRIAKHGVLSYKISDTGYDQKPFDSFCLAGVPAFVVVMFYKRGQKEFFMLDVDCFVSEASSSARRSLTRERALLLGRLCHLA